MLLIIALELNGKFTRRTTLLTAWSIVLRTFRELIHGFMLESAEVIAQAFPVYRRIHRGAPIVRMAMRRARGLQTKAIGVWQVESHWHGDVKAQNPGLGE